MHFLLLLANSSPAHDALCLSLSAFLPVCCLSVCLSVRLSVLILPYISHSHIRRITAPSCAPGHGSRLMPLVPRASEEDTRVLDVVVLWPVPVTASGTPLSPTSQAFSCGPSAKQQRAANLEEAKEADTHDARVICISKRPMWQLPPQAG